VPRDRFKRRSVCFAMMPKARPMGSDGPVGKGLAPPLAFGAIQNSALGALPFLSLFETLKTIL
jgi:hypothetical protein